MDAGEVGLKILASVIGGIITVAIWVLNLFRGEVRDLQAAHKKITETNDAEHASILNTFKAHESESNQRFIAIAGETVQRGEVTALREHFDNRFDTIIGLLQGRK